MSDWRGDYMGFTYAGVHSSDLGIVRVSDGSRFNEDLLPQLQDKTTQVPGGDGMYYFGSYFGQRQFNVSFAFDDLKEEQIAQIKRIFGDKKIHDLIFDERPYKVYSAKVTGTATLKHLAFSEGETNRLYKGEGSIQFTCFYPFARCRFKNLDDYSTIPEYAGLTKDEKTKRINEWLEASRIPRYPQELSSLANFGDIPAPFGIAISGEGKIDFSEGHVSWKLPEGKSAYLNTKTGLAIDESTGEILNRYLTGNTCLKIPVGLTWNGLGQYRDDIEFDCYYF